MKTILLALAILGYAATSAASVPGPDDEGFTPPDVAQPSSGERDGPGEFNDGQPDPNGGDPGSPDGD